MKSEREQELWEELSDREALGEPLTAEERVWRDCRSQSDALRVRESELYRLLAAALGRAGGLAPKQDRLITKAMNAFLDEHGGFVLPRLGLGRRAAFGAGVLGAALALGAMVLYLRSGAFGVASPRGHSVTLAFSEGEVRGDGALLGQGATLGVGSVLETGEATSCIELERQIVACAGPHTRLELSELGNRQQLTLQRGHLVSVLAHQPSGTEFLVTTRAGSAAAVGTVFALEVLADGETSLRVAEGAVSARTSQAELLVRPGQELRFGAGVAAVVSRKQQERDRHVLAALARFAPESARRAEAAYVTRAASPSPSTMPVLEQRPARLPARVVKTAELAAVAPAVPSAAELLEQAAKERGQGAYLRAARAYERLMKAYPTSPEGRTALLGLAEIRLSHLGSAQGALDLYEAYLRGGGSLSQEARYGKIQALAALGRGAEARRESVTFLQRYPKSPYARSLEQKLALP